MIGKEGIKVRVVVPQKKSLCLVRIRSALVELLVGAGISANAGVLRENLSYVRTWTALAKHVAALNASARREENANALLAVIA